MLYHLRQRGWLRPPPERLVNRTTVNSVLGNPVLWTWVETGSYARSLGYCQYIPWSRRSFPYCMCLPPDFLSLSSTCFAPAHRCSARADKTAASGRKRQRTRSILAISTMKSFCVARVKECQVNGVWTKVLIVWMCDMVIFGTLLPWFVRRFSSESTIPPRCVGLV